MKKVLAILLALAMVMGLVACGGAAASTSEAAPAESKEEAAESKEEASEAAPAEESKEEAEAPADDVDYTQGNSFQMNIASTFAGEGFIHDLMVIAKDYIEEKSGGRIEVVIHPAGALGSAKEICEGMKDGTIEAGAMGDEDVDFYAPEYSIYSVPYAYTGKDHYIRFLRLSETEVFPIIAEKSGSFTAAWAYRGSRDVTANKPIVEPSDLKGLKFRLPNTPIRVAVFEAYGASPTVVEFSELYMALKTGTVDAQENPPETIYSYKYYEAQKYISMTQHIQCIARYLISQKWFDTLDPQDQDLIKEGFKYAQEKTLEDHPDPDADYLKLIEETGQMEVVEPNLQAFIDQAARVVEKWAADNWADGLYDLIQSVK